MNHANFNCGTLIKGNTMRKKLWIGFSLLVLLTISSWGYISINNQNHKYIAKVPTKDSQLKIVALGDSLTQGTGDNRESGGYPKRVGNLLAQKTHKKIEVLNFGKEGNRSDQIMVNLEQSNVQRKAIKTADAILLTAGGNDLIKRLQGEIVGHSGENVERKVAMTLPQYQKNLEQLLKTIRKYNTTAPIFLFGNYNPLYVYFPKFTTFNSSVKMYNTVNRDMINKYNGHYVSIFKQLTYGQYQTNQAQKELQNEINKNKVSFLAILADSKTTNVEKNKFISPIDHFHPNNQGYNLMAREMVKKMLLYDTWSDKK